MAVRKRRLPKKHESFYASNLARSQIQPLFLHTALSCILVSFYKFHLSVRLRDKSDSVYYPRQNLGLYYKWPSYFLFQRADSYSEWAAGWRYGSKSPSTLLCWSICLLHFFIRFLTDQVVSVTVNCVTLSCYSCHKLKETSSQNLRYFVSCEC